MSAKKGIKKFGERAVAAMIKEFKQIHEVPMSGKPVVRPVDPHTLSLEQKTSVVSSNFNQRKEVRKAQRENVHKR